MLRSIAPENGVMERIKREILAERRGFSMRVLWQKQPSWAHGFVYALAILSLVLIPALSVNRGPSLSSLKDAGKLSAEAASLPISIELREVSYQENRSEIIGDAITEIKDTNVRHLKNGIIESEMDASAKPSNSEEEINRLLDEVTM